MTFFVIPMAINFGVKDDLLVDNGNRVIISFLILQTLATFTYFYIFASWGDVGVI